MRGTVRFTARDAALHWRTLHIEVPGGTVPLERLLLDVVRPWTARALAAGWVGGWFLTRPPWDPAGRTPPRLLLQVQHTDRPRLPDLAVRVETFLTDQPGVRTAGDLVVERAFQPTIERFGGEHGTAVVVAHQLATAPVVLNLIENAPEPDERLLTAAWLLAASGMARGGDRQGAVAWLRRYGGRQPGSPPVTEIRPLRSTADQVRDRTIWQRLLDGARIASAAADGDLGTWFRLEHRTWSTLVELRAAGRLSVPPDDVFDTLVRLTHDQIGLLPQDNRRMAWLMATALDADRHEDRYRGNHYGRDHYRKAS